MRFKSWLLREATVKVGETFQTTNWRGDVITLTVRRIEGGKAWVAPDHYPPDHPGIEMPLASVAHFKNDLNRKVDIGSRRTGDQAVDMVLDGKATYLGKGDDGVVFEAGDEIVKVSTTVPYIPENPGHISPLASVQRLKKQWQTSEAMRAAGVPGILPSRFLARGDKGFIVRARVDIHDKLTPEQLKEVRDSMRAMHHHGWSLNDDVQVGERDGRMWHFDTGKADKGDDWSFESDMDRLSRLYSKSDQSALFAPWGKVLEKQWEGMLNILEDSVTDRQMAMFMQYKRKRLPFIYQAMMEEFPRIGKQLTWEYEQLMDLVKNEEDDE